MLPDRDGTSDLMSECLAKRHLKTRVVVVERPMARSTKRVEAPMRLRAYEFSWSRTVRNETRFLSAVSNALAELMPTLGTK